MIPWGLLKQGEVYAMMYYLAHSYRYHDTVGVAIHDAMIPWESRFMMP